MGIVDEFQWVKFCLQHHNPLDFTMPRWVSLHPIFLVVTRGIFAIYCIALMTMSVLFGVEGSAEGKSPKWLLFATSWNYMFITLYFALAFGLSVTQAAIDCCHCDGSGNSSDKSLRLEVVPITKPNGHSLNLGQSKSLFITNKRKPQRLKLPWRLKIFWIIFNIAINISTLIVIGYWGLMHDYKKKIEFKFVTYLFLDRHGINFVLVLIDFFLHKIPIRFFHFIYPVVVALAFVIFSVVHWIITGDKLYDFIDWKNDKTKTVACAVGIFVFIIGLQLIWYWLDRLKKKCTKRPADQYDLNEHDNYFMT